MSSLKHKKSKTWVWVLLALVAFLGVGQAFLHAGGCEDAFSRCMNDPRYRNFFGLLYCTQGYLFCLKYIDK